MATTNSASSFAPAQAAPGVSLDFKRVPLSGRDEELSKLSNALDSTCHRAAAECQISRRSAWIEGQSGTGKSVLVQQFLSTVRDQEEQVVMGTGKFEEGSAGMEPFEALEDALLSVFEQASERRNGARACSSKASISQADLKVLGTSFPRLRDFLAQMCSNTKFETVLNDSQDPSQSNFERVRFALRTLVKLLSQSSAVILWLDDIQWASDQSLQLIQTLLTDRAGGRKFLLIGSHRPVAPDSSLARLKQQLPPHMSIVLDNLKPDTVLTVLQALLRREESDLQALAETVQMKTAGNAFFIKQFLLLLQEKGLLYYSVQTYRWEWDLHKIAAETDVADNVLEMVTSKLHTAPTHIQKALLQAAFLGLSRIDVTVLYALLHPGQDESSEESKADMEFMTLDEVVETLREAASVGFVEELSPDLFKFSHDRIREGAYELMPAECDRRKMHLSIGRKLRRLLESNAVALMDRDKLLLQTVGQLNHGEDFMGAEEKHEVAILNYDAALLAMNRSAFGPATEFLYKAVSMLGQSPCQTHYDLRVKIGTSLARALYCCGKAEESLREAECVLRHARKLEEKLPVHHTQVLCLLNDRKPEEAKKVVLDVLEELGAPLPSARAMKIRVFQEQLKVRKALKDMSDDDLLQLPLCTDPMISEIGGFLERLTEIAAQNNDQTLLAMSLLRSIQLTLTHGVNALTASSLVSWGLLLAQFGARSEAYRFGRIGLTHAKRGRGGSHDARAILKYYYGIYHWRESYQQGVEPSSAALHSLWTNGVVENVLMDTIAYLNIYFCSGYNLEPLAKDIDQYNGLLDDYGFNLVRDNNTPFFQMISNLTAPYNAETSKHLDGKYQICKQCMLRWRKGKNQVALRNAHTCRMILAYLFGDFELAFQMSERMGSVFGDGPSVMVPLRYFFRGMSAFSLYAVSGKAKHWRKGMTVLRLFDKWLTEGVVNTHPMLLILEAEKLAATKRAKSTAVEEAFQEAIVVSGKLGILHLQAIANERAGWYHVHRSDPLSAAPYLENARDLYADWGALSKVQHMEEVFKGILVSSSNSTSSTRSSSRSSGLRAKSRLGDLSSSRNQTLQF